MKTQNTKRKWQNYNLDIKNHSSLITLYSFNKSPNLPVTKSLKFYDYTLLTYHSSLFISCICWLLTIGFIKCEWQWTKETGWVNIRKIKLGNSAKLNKAGEKLLQEGKCEDASQYFIGAYKTSKSTNFEQKVMLNLAKAWICAKKTYRAYSVMKLMSERYPNSKYIEEIIKLNYEIGFNFLHGAKKEIWGAAILPAKSIGHNIMQKFIEKYPYSKHTQENLIKYANLMYSTKDYDVAFKYYKKYVELYPKDEYSSFAVVRMFQSKQNTNLGQYYDKTNIEELETELTKLYFKDNKKDVIDEESYKKLKRTVENLKAKSDFDVAMYYLKIGKKNAAKVYLQSIVNEYPRSVYAEKAKEEINKLTK